jgi:hypothetical protein
MRMTLILMTLAACADPDPKEILRQCEVTRTFAGKLAYGPCDAGCSGAYEILPPETSCPKLGPCGAEFQAEFNGERGCCVPTDVRANNIGSLNVDRWNWTSCE